MKVWWFATAGLVLIGLAAVAFAVLGPTLAGGEQVEYLTTTVAMADVTDEVVATGTLQAARTYSLSFGSEAAISNTMPSTTDSAATTDGSADSASGETSTVTWSVTAVNVTVGDHVAKGDVLATSDTSDLQAEIAVARAQVAAAEEQVDAADTDQASATAESALLAAERTLAQLRTARKHVRLVAPAAGTVTTLNIEEGTSAPGGAAIVIASDAMVATGTVSEADVSTIATGQEATITLSAIDAELSGQVAEVALSGSSTSGVVGFGILIRLDEVPDGGRPGMSADISVVAAEALDVLAVASAAIDGSAGSYTVTVLAADGSTETRAVEVGLVTDDLAEITDGLSAGETVVTGTASDQQTTTNTGGFGGPGGGGFGGPGGGGFAPPGGD
jgi:macrolide-specific efflux system membrane fusion protein